MVGGGGTCEKTLINLGANLDADESSLPVKEVSPPPEEVLFSTHMEEASPPQ